MTLIALQFMSIQNTMMLLFWLFFILVLDLGVHFVIDGKVLRGKDNIAAEVGHIPFKKKPYKCSCGRDDCLELSVSGKVFGKTALKTQMKIQKNDFLDGLKTVFHTTLNLFDSRCNHLRGRSGKTQPIYLRFSKK
jgi:hypothetical protein